MEPALEVLGSIVAAAIIPFAVYLYLRTREQRHNATYQRLREEIARMLTYQIGEGRTLSAFEIRAVIDSKLRDHQAGSGMLTADEVVEDLVSEISATVTFDGQRKELLIENLRRIHDQLSPAGEHGILSHGRRLGHEALSTVYGWSATVLTVSLLVGGAIALQSLGTQVATDRFLLCTLLGLVGSLVSLIVAAAITIVARRLGQRERLAQLSRDGVGAERSTGVGAFDNLTEAATRLRQRVVNRGLADPSSQPSLATRMTDGPVR